MLFGLFKRTSPSQKIKELMHKMISQEEEFIITYMNLLKEEEFAQIFEQEEEARKYIQTLITESTRHKKDFEDILNKI